MREIKGAVFDADGTLFDSMGLWDRAGEIYLRRKGIRPGEDTKEQLETMTMEESAEYFRSSYGIRLERDEIIDEFNRMIYDCYEKVIRIKYLESWEEWGETDEKGIDDRRFGLQRRSRDTGGY